MALRLPTKAANKSHVGEKERKSYNKKPFRLARMQTESWSHGRDTP